MTTPTPAGKHPSVQVVATPPVSTPFSTGASAQGHPAFSPHGPRSVVPSPQQVKKSPANSNTLYGYPGTGSTGGMGGMGVYDSPSAAMALGGMGDIGGLGALDGVHGIGIGTPGATGHALLGPHMGGVTGMGRVDEDERRRRLGVVMDILKTNKGRLSEAGIERLARRVGLECLWEPHMGSGGVTKTLIIAGSALALDIDFANNVVQKVALSFPESPEIVTRHTEKAGDILLRDLKMKEGESPLTKMLDRFAGNLERLARADQLSVIPGLNCHEAIAGIYESLRRLHTWEVERLKESGDYSRMDEHHLEKVVLCTRSGRPVMHTRDRLGLSLDYWQEKRRITTKGSKKVEPKTWSLLVECAPLSALVYTPLRISENWISADIQKADPPAEEIFLAAENGPVLDWLDPENTMLPSTEPPKTDAMEGVEQHAGQKFPEVMFVAKFDPTVIVPYGLAAQIYNSTSAPIDMYQTTTFDELMFPHGPAEKVEPSDARSIKQEVDIPIFGENGERTTRIHKNNLFIEKIDYGRTLTELPFSHPRQLVEMLPALRQYTFLSTVLSNSFGAGAKPVKKEETDAPKKSKRDDFADFMAQASTAKKKTLEIDVSLITQPVPRLQVVFPFKRRTANVTFDIKLNGVVEVVSQNIIPGVDAMGEGKGKEKSLSVQDLGKMLEVTEDLGIWAEFVIRRLG